MNWNGFGNCVESDMDIRICYVVKPSTCPDLIDGVYYNEEQYSEKACHMRAIHETNSKKETTNRTVSKPSESNMHSGNQLIIHEKYHSSLQCLRYVLHFCDPEYSIMILWPD